MTVEEFKLLWARKEAGLPVSDNPEKDNNDGLHKRICPGEWRHGRLGDKGILLEKCTGYYNKLDGTVYKSLKSVGPVEFGEKKPISPMYDRYFIVEKGNSRELWSFYKVRGECPETGKPGTLLYDIGTLSIKQVEAFIDDGSFVDWSKHSDKAPRTYIKREKFDVTTIGDIPFSTEYDGVSLLAVMNMRPKGTYNYFLNMILHEGGSIDENMIIHKNPDAPELPKL